MNTKSKKIKIVGKNYNIKPFTYRALFLFEEIAKKPVSDIATFKDQVTYFYCVLKASDKSFEYTFDEFIDLLDDGKINLEELTSVIDGDNEESKKK